jgi:tetratricopeptide (TPR) repeat protein
MAIIKRPALLFWLAVSLVLGVVWNLSPLLETIGYEYSLFSALLSSLVAGHLGVLFPHAIRQYAPLGFWCIYLRLLKQAYAVPLLLLLLSLLNGFRVPFCNLPEGLGFFALMPLFGVAIAAAIGLTIGLAAPGRISGTLLWAALFILSLAIGLYRFYATPAVYLFHPFAGYYPGVLYDRLIQIDTRLLTYRVTTVVQTLAILHATALLYDPKRVSLSTHRFEPGTGLFFRTVGMLTLAWLFQLLSSHLGHQTDRNDLIRALPVHVATKHLDLYFPEETESTLRRDLTADARFSLHQVGEYLDLDISNRISVFFFLDAEHKGRLIGAAQTNVAKPWRREVYVILESPPHAVLRHELVHAVSADFGRGPFRIAGGLGGLVPNPALIEGLATAGGGVRGDLTVHQWAAAMNKLEILPPLEKLFGLGFFDVAASAAYTAAGSFCDYVSQQYGAKALRSAYFHSDFEKGTGEPLGRLARDWLEHLKRIPLSPADLAAAEHRFDRTPVIRTTCVHEVARICRAAWRYTHTGAYDAAAARFAKAHRKSGEATATYRNLFWNAVAAGDRGKQREMGNHIINGAAFTRADKSAAREILADLDRQAGKPGRYSDIYAELAETAAGSAGARRLWIKAYLAAYPTLFTDQILEVLTPGLNSTAKQITRVALVISSAAHDHPSDPVFQYLLARQYFNVEDYASALNCLNSATGLDKVLPAVHTEARMLRGKSLLFLEWFHQAEQVFEEVADDSGVRQGIRAAAADWSARARFMRHI